MGSDERENLRDDVARRVMGWETARIKWAYDGDATLWRSPDRSPVMTQYSWRPDENDAQCMRVVDRMVELGFDCTMGVSRDRAFAVFERERGELPRATHHERRLAVLTAALEAVRR